MDEEIKTKVLFLCTGNCCRSQMAEAILRHLDPVRFEAFSAGSWPAGFVHPLAIAVMQELDVPMVEPRSKSWDEFADTVLDVVITLCDDAARETCPVWPGTPVQAHWPLPDPSFHPGDEVDRFQFALAVVGRLRTKIEKLVALDFAHTDPEESKAELDRIGEL